MAMNNESWWRLSWINGDTVRASVRMVMGVFAIILFLLAIRIVWEGDQDSAARAGVAIGGGGFCLIFFFLTQFKKFKGFGIEAESWEREMEDAQRITNNLRDLTRLVAEPSIMVLMRTGRWNSSTSRREAYDLVHRFEELLTATDTSPEKIKNAVADYYRFTLFDMVNQLRKPLKILLDEKTKPFIDRLDEFGSPVTDVQGHLLASEKMRDAKKSADVVMDSLSLERITAAGFQGVINAMRECELLKERDIDEFLEKFKEDVADIRFFEEHKKLRRPEVWFADKDRD